MVSWTHGDNHDGAPPHSCLGLRHDKIDTTIFGGPVKQAQDIWGVGVREQSVQLYGPETLWLCLADYTRWGIFQVEYMLLAPM